MSSATDKALVSPRRFFDAIAGRYDRDFSPSAAESRRRARRWEHVISNGARVLDLGVGTGRELPPLLDRGCSVTGIDISPEMLTRCGARRRPIELVEHDFFESIPFEDASYDAVLALHGSLAHAPGVDALGFALGEIARCLRPGGVLVIESPSPEWLARSAPLFGGESDEDTATARIDDEPSGLSILALAPTRGAWRTLLESHRLALVSATIDSGELVLIAEKPSAQGSEEAS